MSTRLNFKNLNPIEKLYPKPFYLYTNITENDLKKATQHELSLKQKVDYSNFDSNTGCLNWNLYNFSDDDKFFALARGTPYVSPYYFLEFYTEVYKAFGIVQFINDNNMYDNYPYKVCLVDYTKNERNYAGTFYVPAGQKLTLEECGFSNNNMPNFYELIPVHYKQTEKYLVEYNFMEIIDYTLQTGIIVDNAPFPIYTQKVGKFSINLNEYLINTRTFTKMNWITNFIHKRL